MTLVIWYFPFLWKIKANKILKKYFQVGVIVDMREKNLNESQIGIVHVNFIQAVLPSFSFFFFSQECDKFILFKSL